MKTLVAVAQMTATDDRTKNLTIIESLIERAALLGAKFLSLPENFAFMAPDSGPGRAEELTGPTLTKLRALAVRHHIWLSLGGFQEKIAGENKIYNTHVVLDPGGSMVAKYRKIHLFSVCLPTGAVYEEHLSVKAGQEVVAFSCPYFTGGLSICYDLRFSELFWALRERGAELIFVPAAFTETTGKAHWEVLLRARAIETQSYIAAAAQIGENSAGRFTYGHAMIVDPWGVVLAQCGAANDLAMAEIDTDYCARLRRGMPFSEHRRSCK